ncbi:hypothetical protein K523DRAFT_134780 [Schizophyllum commune Tattone D]|nr:hypothetical protein K523DRAFT_134780 [Schizophyllum commune Tattone D]
MFRSTLYLQNEAVRVLCLSVNGGPCGDIEQVPFGVGVNTTKQAGSGTAYAHSHIDIQICCPMGLARCNGRQDTLAGRTATASAVGNVTAFDDRGSEVDFDHRRRRFAL